MESEEKGWGLNCPRVTVDTKYLVSYVLYFMFMFSSVAEQ